MPLRQVGPGELAAATDDSRNRHSCRLVADLPILIDFENSVLDGSATPSRSAESVIGRAKYEGATAVAKRLASPPNPRSSRNVRRLTELLEQDATEPEVLAAHGGTVGNGTRPLCDDPGIKVYAFRTHGTSNVQFVADAHRIPLPDATFDGVVVQAVLEHVLEPRVVATEVRRVLKPRSPVHPETRFMQHAHEDAYDFARLTGSGHRHLFRGFDVPAPGTTAGAGTQLLWSSDFFARSLFRSRAAGKLVKLAYLWFRHSDDVVPGSLAVDVASGDYFLGRRADREIGPKEIIAYYQGAQR